MISIIIPTLTDREEWLKRCQASYARTTRGFELIVLHNLPTCGIGWQMGAEQARGDYIHFSADDLTPHPGWAEAAIACVESGKLPCPLVLNPDGTIQSCGTWGRLDPEGSPAELARIPFLSRAQWEAIAPMEPWHYYTDNLITFKAEQVGIPTVVCQKYLFTHHFAEEGRLGQDRMDADFLAFENYKDHALGAKSVS